MTNERVFVVVPWHTEEVRDAFCAAWDITGESDNLILQHDADLEGCAVTKNRGIARAVVRGATIVVVLDSDCFPSYPITSLDELADRHVEALEPQLVDMFQAVTSPPSRGTPYFRENLKMAMPVAASMGFWNTNGDHCAVRQLSTQNGRMQFYPQTIFGRYFPLCGMNLAFRPTEWSPWYEFINVDRFDDIWQGWLWQKEAYRRGYCFNLNGPVVKHSRQSNVWKNLEAETRHLEASETLWRKIAESPHTEYEDLRKLLPV